VSPPRVGLTWDLRLGRAGLVAALGVGLVVCRPDAGTWGPALLAASLLAGLPHGALDHALADTWWSARHRREQVGFHVGYLVVTAAVLGVWWLSPRAGLLSFLAISAWHFGESDLLHLPPDQRTNAMAATRGALVVLGALLVSFAPTPTQGALGTVALLGVHVLTLLGARPWNALLSTIDAVALTLLLLGGGLELGLALYFVLWHTPDHIDAVRNDIAGLDDLRALALEALPRTLVSVVGIAVGATWIAPSAWPQLTLMAIAALTLPHALVVHLTFRAPAATSRAARAGRSRRPPVFPDQRAQRRLANASAASRPNHAPPDRPAVHPHPPAS